MHEAFCRLSNQSADVQVDGVALAILRALEDVPAPLRAIVVEMLSDLNTMPPGRVEDRDLLAEIASLRAYHAQRDTDAAGADRKDATAGELNRLVEEVFGQGAASSTADVTMQGLTSAIELLCGFVEDLTKAFGSPGGRRGKSPDGYGDALKSVLLAQLSEDQQLGQYLDSLKARVGTLALNLPRICANGARSLLEELEPAVVEDVARSAGRVGIGPFKYRDLWLAFERRYTELVSEEGLYERYFDGHLKRLVHRSGPGR